MAFLLVPHVGEREQRFTDIVSWELGKDAVLQLQGGEQTGMREKHFGPAQEKKPGFLQREVKALEDPPLCFGIEIHDGVAANEQIQARDRGVLNQVVSAENNAAAQFRPEDVAVCRVREILLQIFLWNGLDLFLAVTAGAGFAESRFILTDQDGRFDGS